MEGDMSYKHKKDIIIIASIFNAICTFLMFCITIFNLETSTKSQIEWEISRRMQFDKIMNVLAKYDWRLNYDYEVKDIDNNPYKNIRR